MNPEFRKQALSEWRGWVEPEDPARNLRLASEVIGPWLESLAGSDLLGEERIKSLWSRVVGAFLAQHAQPIALRRGTLVVRVVQPSVRYALEQGMKNELLDNLQKAFGRHVVHAVSFTTV